MIKYKHCIERKMISWDSYMSYERNLEVLYTESRCIDNNGYQ
jgi:hypothetical protein